MKVTPELEGMTLLISWDRLIINFVEININLFIIFAIIYIYSIKGYLFS